MMFFLGRSHLVCAYFVPGYVHQSENMIHFFAYLHDSFYQFHLMLSIWFENFVLISHMGKVL